MNHKMKEAREVIEFRRVGNLQMRQTKYKSLLLRQ